MTEYEIKSLELFQEIINKLDSLDKSFKVLESLALADDPKYFQEVEKDGFHPPIG